MVSIANPKQELGNTKGLSKVHLVGLCIFDPPHFRIAHDRVLFDPKLFPWPLFVLLLYIDAVRILLIRYNALNVFQFEGYKIRIRYYERHKSAAFLTRKWVFNPVFKMHLKRIMLRV